MSPLKLAVIKKMSSLCRQKKRIFTSFSGCLPAVRMTIIQNPTSMLDEVYQLVRSIALFKIKSNGWNKKHI